MTITRQRGYKKIGILFDNLLFRNERVLKVYVTHISQAKQYLFVRHGTITSATSTGSQRISKQENTKRAISSMAGMVTELPNCLYFWTSGTPPGNENPSLPSASIKA